MPAIFNHIYLSVTVSKLEREAQVLISFKLLVYLITEFETFISNQVILTEAGEKKVKLMHARFFKTQDIGKNL